MFEKSLKTLRLTGAPGMEEVRKAYIRLTRRYPPEHFPDKFKQVKQAYEELSLAWSALEPMAQSLSKSGSLTSLTDTLLGEALELARSQDLEHRPPDLDARLLDPVLRTGEHQRQVKSILKAIKAEGLPYRD